jgi:hypothetical protein
VIGQLLLADPLGLPALPLQLRRSVAGALSEASVQALAGQQLQLAELLQSQQLVRSLLLLCASTLALLRVWPASDSRGRRGSL